MKFSKTPSHKTPTNKLHTFWAYINSRDHGPLSKQLRHALLRILQWNKQPSLLQVVYPTEESFMPWLQRHSKAISPTIEDTKWYIMIISLTTGLFNPVESSLIWDVKVVYHYYKVITWLQGMWLKYTHDSQGCAVPEGGCVYFSHIPSKHVITIMLHTLVVESIVAIIAKL